jgi:hypothetical protein
MGGTLRRSTQGGCTTLILSILGSNYIVLLTAAGLYMFKPAFRMCYCCAGPLVQPSRCVDAAAGLLQMKMTVDPMTQMQRQS